MAQGLNRVTLYGNLGADSELRFTNSGTPVLNFRMATTEKYKKDEEWIEKTEWHSVVLWGKRGEALAQYMLKGKTVLVEGALQTSSWEDKEGNKRYKTEINARNVILAGNGGSGSRSEDTGRKADDDDSLPGDGSDPDEIPF